MTNPFNTSDEARAYITAVIEAEARQASMPLDDFEKKLLALRADDLFSARFDLARTQGKEDDGRGAINRLTSLLRQARRGNRMPLQHPSGLAVATLVKAAESCLDRSRDLMWLIVHDAQNDVSPGAQKVISWVALVLLGLLVLGLIGWKAWRVGGTGMVVVVGVILLIGFAIDRYRLAKRARG